MAPDLVDVVRRAVTERDPIDAGEAASIARLLAELDRLDDPFDQDADPVHVTGSAIVVGRRGVVLLKHKRLGLWLQPGGHVDPGESPWEAALREAREETGLDVRFAGLAAGAVPPLVHEETGLDVRFAGLAAGAVPPLVHVDVHPGGRGHTHLDLRYLVDGGEADPAPPPGESQEIGWFDWPDAVSRASDDRLKSLLTVLAPGRPGRPGR